MQPVFEYPYLSSGYKHVICRDIKRLFKPCADSMFPVAGLHELCSNKETLDSYGSVGPGKDNIHIPTERAVEHAEHGLATAERRSQ